MVCVQRLQYFCWAIEAGTYHALRVGTHSLLLFSDEEASLWGMGCRSFCQDYVHATADTKEDKCSGGGQHNEAGVRAQPHRGPRRPAGLLYLGYATVLSCRAVPT